MQCADTKWHSRDLHTDLPDFETQVLGHATLSLLPCMKDLPYQLELVSKHEFSDYIPTATTMATTTAIITAKTQ